MQVHDLCDASCAPPLLLVSGRRPSDQPPKPTLELGTLECASHSCSRSMRRSEVCSLICIIALLLAVWLHASSAPPALFVLCPACPFDAFPACPLCPARPFMLCTRSTFGLPPSLPPVPSHRHPLSSGLPLLPILLVFLERWQPEACPALALPSPFDALGRFCKL